MMMMMLVDTCICSVHVLQVLTKDVSVCLVRSLSIRSALTSSHLCSKYYVSNSEAGPLQLG